MTVPPYSNRMPRLRAGRLDGLTSARPTFCVLEGRRIALIRLGEAVHAVDDACPHAGGPLSQGAVDGEALICPYHTWMWDLTTGACIAGGRSTSLRIYPARVDAGDIWVDLPDS